MAALGQALIPYLTGEIIDFASIDPDRQKFMITSVKLVVVSLGCAIVTGIRGGLFTVAMTRLNVRIRTSLFASLLRQEIGFYDSSKTGKFSTK
jgi:ATP-binding cassette subfamily B (MDR/TAP) protein 9